MTPRKNSPKPNGHAGPNGRPNGHGPAIAERGGVPAPASSCPPANRALGSASGLAASVDARETHVASASALAAVAGSPMRASTAPETYAAAATPAPHPPFLDASKVGPSSKEDLDNIPPGEMPLPANPADFVDEVHRETNLFEAWRTLLRSKDEKIRQRAVEKLTEMRYKGATALADEPQRIIIDMPGPTRD